MNRVYWRCSTSLPPHDGIYVLRIIVASVGLLANTCTLVLLCRLTGCTRASLTMLRTLMFSGVVLTFLEFPKLQESLNPSSLTNEVFGAGFCAVWLSGFPTAALHLFESAVLVYMVSNRAMQIAFKYQYSFSTNAYIDVVCASVLFLVCFLFALPQCFAVAWRDGHCECLDKDLPYGRLLLIYSASFVKYGVDIFLSAPVLSISSVKIMLWVSNTPPAKLIDTLNGLAFAATLESRRREFDQPKGWWTASMCMVALSVNFLVLTAYSTVQRIVSVAGVFLLDSNSYWTRVGNLLMLLNVTTAPLIVLVYIPALRHLIKSFYWKMAAGIRIRQKNVPLPCQNEGVQ